MRPRRAVATVGPAPAGEPSRRREPAGAGRADRRARLHPERPVRAVLPRRPGRLLRGGRARRHVPEQGTDYDVVALVGQGEIDLGLADGTSVIPAVSQGIPIKYVATIYGQFPSIVFAKASSGIASAADLKGKKLGIPGRYGSSWIMLQALLASADLTPDDLEIVEYPDFGQGAAVAQGAVDAATGFANNEPVQLELSGEEVNVLHVDDIMPLPGQRADRRRRDASTPKRDALDGVRRGDAARDGGDRCRTRRSGSMPRSRRCRIWRRSAIPRRRSSTRRSTSGRGPAQEAHGLGAIEPADWEKSIAYLTILGLVPNPVTADDLIDTGLLPVGQSS